MEGLRFPKAQRSRLPSGIEHIAVSFVPRGIGDLKNQGLGSVPGAHPKHADGIETEAKIAGLSEKPCPWGRREGKALENQVPKTIGKASARYLPQVIRFPKGDESAAI